MRIACLWFQKDVSIEEVAKFCSETNATISLRKKRAVFVEIGTSTNLYAELDFIKNTANFLKDIGLTASIAIGDSVSVALLKARFNNPDIDSIPLGGLVDVADPFDHDMILRKYTERMVLSLQDLGVLTISQFKKLPAAEVKSRYGAVGALCRQRLQDDSQVAWRYWQPSEEKPVEKNNLAYKLADKLPETHGHESTPLARPTSAPPPQQKTASPTPAKTSSAARGPVRPLSLIKPLPIEVSADAIKVEGKSYKIAKWNEYSERVSGEANDYYQLEFEDGSQFTIFETPERQFFLQGYSG
ncbi:MAG: hypothetical protein AABZ31_06205 [Bdellovibrionota bacterium]